LSKQFNHSRTAKTGLNKTGDYILDNLDHSFYNIKKQSFIITNFVQLNIPTLSLFLNTSIIDYEFKKDFVTLNFHGTGDFKGKTQNIDNFGCFDSDFDNFISGRIAIIKRGDCSFFNKSETAYKFGARAVLFILLNYRLLYIITNLICFKER
jgi:hypothetical protein